MKSYALVHQMLTLVQEFEKESKNDTLSLTDFVGFLVSHTKNSAAPTISAESRFGTEEKQSQELAFQIDNNISRLVIYMSRYAKNYIKKALENTPLITAEDFTCLAVLHTHQDLTKGELITKNIQEKTSGTEVIRRLLAAGLAQQWDDDTDKRSKRIAITQKGKDLLAEVFVDMTKVGKMVTGDLTITEKMNLQYLLQKLENFHNDVYLNKTIATKQHLMEMADDMA